MRVKVSFEIDVPTSQAVCKDDVDEWINFELGALGGMSGANPLCMTDIDDAKNIIIDEV